MGRLLQADTSIEGYIEHLTTTGQWHVGLVVGQMKGKGDFVVRLIRCPDPAEDTASVEEQDGDEDTASEKSKATTTLRPKSLELVDEHWIATHALQVNRMLPGGLSVLGIFAIAPPKMMEVSQIKLKQLISVITNALLKQSSSLESVLLQICSISRKIYNPSDVMSGSKPTEWRYVNSLLKKWCTLNTVVSVDLSTVVSQNILSKSMIKQLQTGLQPYCRAVQNAMGLVNGELRGDDELLDKSETKSKHKNTSFASQNYAIDLLLSKSECSLPNNGVTVPCKLVLKISGQMVGRAFVHHKSTVGEAIQAVKTDLMRSLVSRCELLCEDLELLEVNAEKEQCKTPIRIFTQLPGTPIDFCDYKFEDEKIPEVLERLKELLDIDVTEKDLDVQSEKYAESVDWSLSAGESLSVLPELLSPAPESTLLHVGVAVSGVVAMLAGVTYMIFGDQT